MQTSHERRGGYGGGGGYEGKRERGKLLLISAFTSSGPGLRAPPRCGWGAQGRPMVAALIPPSPSSRKLKHPHTPRDATDTPAGLRGLPPRCPPDEPRCLAPGASRGALHAGFCGKRMLSRRERRRPEGSGWGESSWGGRKAQPSARAGSTAGSLTALKLFVCCKWYGK